MIRVQYHREAALQNIVLALSVNSAREVQYSQQMNVILLYSSHCFNLLRLCGTYSQYRCGLEVKKPTSIQVRVLLRSPCSLQQGSTTCDAMNKARARGYRSPACQCGQAEDVPNIIPDISRFEEARRGLADPQ